MSYTQAQIDIGATALRNYLFSIAGLEAYLVPWNDEEQGSSLILDRWVAGHNVTSCGQALYDQIVAAGYGSRVTKGQCVGAAAAVLAAVGEVKRP